MAIIKSSQWKDALKHESRESKSSKHKTTPVRQLIEKMPGEFSKLEFFVFILILTDLLTLC